MVGAGRAGHDPRVHAAWSPRLIDLAHHEPCRSTPCRALQRRRDDRQPPRGPVHQLGHRPWSTHPTPLPRPKGALDNFFSASNSVRRAASTSRTSGRSAVGPAGRSWTSTPIPARSQAGEEPQEKDHLLEHGVDRPRPFRDDKLWLGINVYRIDVASTDSGAADPVGCCGSGATPKTYFDATFCTNGIARLLSVNMTTAQTVAKTQVPAFHQAVVIVNSSKYGGSGGSIAVVSAAPDANLIGIHEMGHSAFGLADEYSTLLGCDSGETGHDRYVGSEPTQPNVTATASPWNP